MAGRPKKVKAKEPVVEEQEVAQPGDYADPSGNGFNNGVEVTFHLDRDPNDPRNFGPTPSLPSLND